MPGAIWDRNKNKPGKVPNWSFALELGYDEIGKRKRYTRSGFATEKEAAAAYLAAVKEFALDNINKPKYESVLSKRKDRQPLADYLTGWLADPKRKLRDTSAYNYNYLLKGHVIPVIGDILLCNLQSSHIEAMYGSERTMLLTPGSASMGFCGLPWRTPLMRESSHSTRV